MVDRIRLERRRCCQTEQNVADVGCAKWRIVVVVVVVAAVVVAAPAWAATLVARKISMMPRISGVSSLESVHPSINSHLPGHPHLRRRPSHQKQRDSAGQQGKAQQSNQDLHLESAGVVSGWSLS